MMHVTVRAHAKINLDLRVLGPRLDGYHELRTVFQSIALHDVIDCIQRDGPFAIDCAAAGVPLDRSNLVWRAAEALWRALRRPAPIRDVLIRLQKNIPLQAGLGGGSADAAATLGALNELWGCRLDMEALVDMAARVGSDVPAMLAGGPVLVQGRGDVIDPATVDRLWWVLRSFDFGVRSPDAYRWWDEDRASSGPDPASLLVAATKGDPETLGPMLFNDLERPVFVRHPDLAEAKAALLRAGALGAVMSGSGSSIVGLARDEAHAGSLAKQWASARVISGPP